MDTLETAWRDERARIVGSLARRFGDLALAEDAVQEAFAAAASHWPVDGEPDRPGAWLQTTAYRSAIGMMRRRRPTVAFDDDAVEPADTERRSVVDDALVGLLLACCHPALDSASRIALTLRHVCGLSVEEIAAGFVVSDAAMAKRLVRARSKIRDARIPFDVPDIETLADRLDDVRAVIYAVFTEGHLAAVDATTVRTSLCEEAIWLARQVGDLVPDDETSALLALMLFHHARHASRLGSGDEPIRFADQDRAGWDAEALAEARALLTDHRTTAIGPYRIEAAIAALHCAEGDTDWARIADLYAILARLSPSPVFEVNRAIAVGEADGAPSGLAVIEPVLATGRLDGYAPAHAARAALLERAGRPADAVEAWHRAARVSANPAQAAAMRRRADEVRPRAVDGGGDR